MSIPNILLTDEISEYMHPDTKYCIVTTNQFERNFVCNCSGNSLYWWREAQLFKDVDCTLKPVKELSGTTKHYEVIYDKAIYIVMCKQDIVRFDTSVPKDVVAFYTFEDLPDKFYVHESTGTLSARLFNLIEGRPLNDLDGLNYINDQIKYVTTKGLTHYCMQIYTHNRIPYIKHYDDGHVSGGDCVFGTAVGDEKPFRTFIKVHRYTDVDWKYFLNEQEKKEGNNLYYDLTSIFDERNLFNEMKKVLSTNGTIQWRTSESGTTIKTIKEQSAVKPIAIAIHNSIQFRYVKQYIPYATELLEHISKMDDKWYPNYLIVYKGKVVTAVNTGGVEWTTDEYPIYEFEQSSIECFMHYKSAYKFIITTEILHNNYLDRQHTYGKAHNYLHYMGYDSTLHIIEIVDKITITPSGRCSHTFMHPTETHLFPLPHYNDIDDIFTLRKKEYYTMNGTSLPNVSVTMIGDKPLNEDKFNYHKPSLKGLGKIWVSSCSPTLDGWKNLIYSVRENSKLSDLVVPYCEADVAVTEEWYKYYKYMEDTNMLEKIIDVIVTTDNITKETKEVDKTCNEVKHVTTLIPVTRTTIKWADGTETTVECPTKDYNPYYGFAIAVAKYAMGNDNTMSNAADYWLNKVPKRKAEEERKKLEAEELEKRRAERREQRRKERYEYKLMMDRVRAYEKHQEEEREEERVKQMAKEKFNVPTDFNPEDK